MIKNRAGIVSPKLFNGNVDEKKEIPQHFFFRCGKVFNISSVRKIGVSCKLQPLLLKQQMEQYENFEDTWEARENEWSPYVKDDVLSTAFCYARYTMVTEELTNFGIKNSLTLQSLANKFFKVCEMKTMNQFILIPIHI